MSIYATSISVAIPTYCRESELVDTIHQLLNLEFPPGEILIVDQSEEHLPQTKQQLSKLADLQRITWIKRPTPSIPKAMNYALLTAKSDVVLFLDDDVIIDSEIVREHRSEYRKNDICLVAGQIIQSWQKQLGPNAFAFRDGNSDDPDAFMFNSNKRMFIKRFMGGNFSVRRQAAIELGGFDENFVRVALRFEAEFADRLTGAGCKIIFQPKASLKHLRAQEGGTRAYGLRMQTAKPAHTIGNYYYLFTAKHVYKRWRKILFLPFRSVTTRFHLTHPWWIPLSFFAEISGMAWAFWKVLHGPKHIEAHRIASN